MNTLEHVKAALSGVKELLIDGRRVPASSGRTFEVFNPATEERLAEVSEGGARDIDLAVSAARRSFDAGSWRKRPAPERARVMNRYADLLERDAEELALLESLNNGMPLRSALHSVLGSAHWLRWFAGAVQRIGGRAYSDALSLPGEFLAYTRQEPVGVVGVITPWNGPVATFFIKVAPALAAGCSIVHKPSEVTPLTALRIGELALEAGLPPGVVNIVPGFGADAGAAIASHGDIDKISFTGSTAVGKNLVRAAADNLKRVTLELGGKSPCVVFDDAEMELAIPGAAMAIAINSGQACFAGSRLFVQRKSFDRVVAGVGEFLQKLRIGDPLAPDTDLGPLVSRQQQERVNGYVALGSSEGATLISGGQSVPRKGFYVAPSVFAYTDPSIRIVQEEIFGPVLVATPFDSLEDVVPRANATRYGLGGGIFTRDIGTAHRLAARLDTGNVWVNCYSMLDVAMPFGGFKESGWGRELGEEGLNAYLESKAVYVNLASGQP